MLAVFLARPLDRLALGDDVAASLGGRPRRVRLLAAASPPRCWPPRAAALAGLLGFLGLVIPHLVRLAGGTSSHRFVIPASALAGAALLVAADTLARVVLAPIELPVGPLMVVLGVPLFLWLLRGGGVTARCSRPATSTCRSATSTILHGADLTVHAGELVAVVGPNGAGKSTLSRAVSGLQTLGAGDVRWGGTPLERAQGPQDRAAARVHPAARAGAPRA